MEMKLLTYYGNTEHHDSGYRLCENSCQVLKEISTDQLRGQWGKFSSREFEEELDPRSPV